MRLDHTNHPIPICKSSTTTVAPSLNHSVKEIISSASLDTHGSLNMGGFPPQVYDPK